TLAACATPLPPSPAPTLASGPAGGPAPEAPGTPHAPAPPEVLENQTFTVVDGIPQYRIGPGDLLEILLSRGVTQDRLTLTVRTDGSVRVLFVVVTIGGLTAEQAGRVIERALGAYYRSPRVEVLVKEFNSKKVTILGAVGAIGGRGSGVYPLRGRSSLSEFLASVGGVSQEADLEHIQVTRGDGRSVTVNLFAVVGEGERSRDLVLDADDFVFIPTRPPGAERKVFIFGEVLKPGTVPYRSGMTLAEVIAEAGGITEVAAGDATRIIRGNLRDAPTVLTADVEGLVRRGDLRQDVRLQPRDIVIVPRSGLGNWNAFLAKIRPTLEFITLGLQPVIVYETLKD
ncbi:MAG: SLBB domain-containing protein, partial [candidate division NC10 bacterium]|nr:SLBB domain-containing protein [candidate division NC10 bacterium]